MLKTLQLLSITFLIFMLSCANEHVNNAPRLGLVTGKVYGGSKANPLNSVLIKSTGFSTGSFNGGKFKLVAVQGKQEIIAYKSGFLEYRAIIDIEQNTVHDILLKRP